LHQQPRALLGHYAGFASRLFAYVIDLIILASTIALVALLLGSLPQIIELGLGIPREFQPKGLLRTIILFQLSGLVSILFALFYHAFFVFAAGRTPGKALVGLRVLRTDGQRVSFWQAIIRTLSYTLSGATVLLGFLLILIDDRRQALHDKLAGTYVVYAWEARPDETFLAQQIAGLADRRFESASPEQSHQ
jgi:uncharacterized RDD family membrane protein YckC